MESFFNVGIEYSASLTGDEFEFDMKVTTPVTTLCPCSKEISEYGAHNQRADVSIKIKMKKFLWIEDLVEIAEDSASAPVYSLFEETGREICDRTCVRQSAFCRGCVQRGKIEGQ